MTTARRNHRALALACGLLAVPSLARGQATSDGQRAEPVTAPSPPARPSANISPHPDATVTVRIEPERGTAHVALESAEGERPLCTAPCTTQVPPGFVYLITQGDAYPRQRQLLTPRGPSRYVLRAPNGVPVAAGGVFVALGVLGVAASVVLIFAAGAMIEGGNPGALLGPTLGCFGGGLASLVLGGSLLASNRGSELQYVGPLAPVAPSVAAVPGGGVLEFRASF